MSKIFNFVIVPLIVTVFSGIFLYHYSSFFVKEGELVFSQSQFVAPSYDGEDYQFSFVTITNKTTSIQEDVKLQIGAEVDLASVEILKSTERGHDTDFETVIGKDNILIKIAKLRPTEEVSFQFVLRTSEPVILNFFVVSEALLGVEDDASNTEFKSIGIFEVVFTKLPLILLFVSLFILMRKWKGFQSSANDVAFSLLHSGAVSEAKEILSRLVFETNGSVYELTNYACCLSIEGETDASLKFIEASILLNNGDRHDNILMAKLIYAWKSGDFIKARNLLDEFKKYRFLFLISRYTRYKHSNIMKQLEDELVTG
jgi:hypothetical protein